MPCAHVSYPMCHTPRASINSRMGYVNTKHFGFLICEYKIKIHFYFFVYHYVYKTYMFFKNFAITLSSLLKTHISTNTCKVSIFFTYWYLVPQSSRVTQVQARSQFEHLAGIRLVCGTLVVTPSTLKEKKISNQFTTDNRRQLYFKRL